jgi:hypothetical protein
LTQEVSSVLSSVCKATRWDALVHQIGEHYLVIPGPILPDDTWSMGLPSREQFQVILVHWRKR